MKINKETQAIKDTLDQIDLIDIDRTFQPKDTGSLNGYKNKTNIYMLSTRDPLQT